MISPPPLPRRRLGRTNRQVTVIGLGGAGLNSTLYGRTHAEEDSIACVHRALELGIDYIDTSPLYGDSERRIGVALAASGQRDRVFLASKTGTGTRPKDYSGEQTRRSVAQSLGRLQTDRLDLMQIHDPEHEEHWEQALAPGGALDVLIGLKEEGVIGAIGLGVRSHDFLGRAIEHGAFDTILSYADFNPVRQSARDNLFGPAAENDVAVILGSPLLFGLLTDRPWEELLRERKKTGDEPDEQGALRVRQWAETRGVGVVPLTLQYCLREQAVSTVLVGAGSPAEIEQNVRAVTDGPLGPDIWRALEGDLGIR